MASQLNDMPSLSRCTACNATVIAEAAGGVRSDANNVCGKCGLMLVDSPHKGADYFDVIMSRPLGRAARSPRRNG
ncbi:MAG: hypothetical protein U1E81_01360 [Xanthobacteraceae bacterium]